MPNSSDVKPVSLRVQSGNQEGDQPARSAGPAGANLPTGTVMAVALHQYDSVTGAQVQARGLRGLSDNQAGDQWLAAAQGVWNGAGVDKLRTPKVFKVVALGAATAEATIWTPASGKKFRLMGFLLTAGAGSTLTFKDNTSGTTIFAARAATDTPISPNGMGNGILSAAADNVLTVTRGTSATLDGVVWGTEE